MFKHLIFLLALIPTITQAQNVYWQQNADYFIDVVLDDEKNQFAGFERIAYTNNSPDTLKKLYYHLYFNAFQPGSMMDERSLDIQDPDRRVKDRISKLQPDEVGYIRVKNLVKDGSACNYNVVGTLLEVNLERPIAPGEVANLEMQFEGQVPLQIRRSGRDSKEGIDYTMTQWYPKLAEYDNDGWHPNPYVGREFYGVWGSFDVNITLHKKYVVGGTGVKTKVKKSGKQITWNFKAENVHDFAWAADPDYQHDSIEVPGITTLHFYYQTDTLAQQWKEIQSEVVRLFQIQSALFGKYPYEQFSVIQGGDGGMEYPMCTMILGHGTKDGKIGLIAHESFHNWFYGVLASNEFRYPWMDEGFTSYAEEMVLDSIFETHSINPLEKSYKTYRFYAQQPWEEPLTTPADFYRVNAAYSINSYVKGAITLRQLSSIIGHKTFEKGMLSYWDQWKFKHPKPNDFLRVMEEESGLELDWYFEFWVNTTKHIDYGIDTLQEDGVKTIVTLHKYGEMPMPLDIKVTLIDGVEIWYNIPLLMMHGYKEQEHPSWNLMPYWQWTNRTYDLTLNFKMEDIEKIEIDPEYKVADIDLENNVWPAQPKEETEN